MIIREIIETLNSLCNAYYKQERDFTKWFTIPLLVIDDSGDHIVSDPTVVARLFEEVDHCYTDVELPSVEFRVQHLQVVSDKIVVIAIVWDFLNSNQKTEISQEVGYILQKKDNAWKIIALLQPTWWEPTRRREDIKQCVSDVKSV